MQVRPCFARERSPRGTIIAAAVLAVATALSLAGCSGTTNPSVPPLTLTESAPTMANTVASAIVGSLQGGASASNSAQPPLMLSRLFALVLPPTLFASTFTHSCSNGGSVRLDGVASSSGRYSMTNSTATFVGCGFNPGRKAGTMDGALTLNGVWCPGQSSCSGPSVAQPTMPVGIAGSLNVSDLGPEEFGGTIGPSAYSIPITGAGLMTGQPDTPPPPNVNSCPATLSPTSISAGAGGGGGAVSVSVGSTCPWTASSQIGFVSVTGGTSGTGPGTVTFSIAANTGAARSGSLSIAGQSVPVSQAAGTIPTAANLSGTWLLNGQPVWNLSQSGSTVTGADIFPAPPSGVTASSVIAGTLAGSTLVATDTLQLTSSTVAPPPVGLVTVSCSGTGNITAQVTATTMTGTFVTQNFGCTSNVPGVTIPNTPVLPQSFTLTKQ